MSNFFDDLTTGIDPGEALRQQKDAEAKANRLDYLIHRVFTQDEAGAELLELWKESLIMAPTARGGDDMVSVGISEGHKAFIRGILLTIKRVNSDE